MYRVCVCVCVSSIDVHQHINEIKRKLRNMYVCVCPRQREGGSSTSAFRASVLAQTSWINALERYLNMPFWSFLGGLILGKAFIKVRPSANTLAACADLASKCETLNTCLLVIEVNHYFLETSQNSHENIIVEIKMTITDTK